MSVAPASRVAWWLAVGLSLGLAMGCRPAAPRSPAAPPQTAQHPPPANAVEALERAAAMAALLERVDATAVISGVPGLGGLRVTADLHVARPAWLYVGVQAFLGPPVEQVWTDGETFLWRSLRPDAGARGPATPERLAQLLPVALPPGQWVGLVLGLPIPTQPPVNALACAQPPARVGTWCVRLDYQDGAVVELEVAPAGTVETARWRRGNAQAQVTYGPRRGVHGLPLELAVEQQGQRLGIRLVDPRVNGPPPPPALFAPLYGP